MNVYSKGDIVVVNNYGKDRGIITDIEGDKVTVKWLDVLPVRKEEFDVDALMKIDENLTLYRVEYNVNMVHELWVYARNTEHANERFEYLYDNHQEWLPEYHDLDHEVTEISDQLKTYGPMPEPVSWREYPIF